MSRSGADLALLLLGGFRTLVDAAIDELADRGYEDVRPVHDFAMRAIAAGADSASELARRLSITKQSAAKTIAVLQERGYVARDTDPARRPPQAPSGDRAAASTYCAKARRSSTSCATSGRSESAPPSLRASRITSRR